MKPIHHRNAQLVMSVRHHVNLRLIANTASSTALTSEVKIPGMVIPDDESEGYVPEQIHSYSGCANSVIHVNTHLYHTLVKRMF